eukprot:gnl/MRDRNA2_/MRDRNA2_40959_c0_seq1.p1 gnl/MRDRNA2_/MRDRNA2_40959_c0~~gnl/MRDRNA2_/MRDRNA2_40959_c0_seq1.p1  ORF type:complete len:372 (+),score=67.15 gnl/MRDRNA2_/MRDRNA2_40959_c0_seq1:66-1181(+)
MATGLLVVCGASLLAFSEGLRHNFTLHSSLEHIKKHQVSDHLQKEWKLEPWKDSGNASKCRLTDSDLKASVNVISTATYGAQLKSFVEVDPSRFLMATGNERAAAFINHKLTQLGFQVQEQPVNVNLLGTQHQNTSWARRGNPKRGNVIGFLNGTDLSGEAVIFGAHYDSANWIDDDSALKSGSAPGADDDASGIAALLEIGKVISQAHKRNELRRTVVLVAFQAEEVGLWGSKAFVNKLIKAGTFGKPVAALIADMVSFSGRKQVARQAIFSTTKNSPANLGLLDTMAHQAKADGSLNGFEVDYTGCCSDHEPFLVAGYPAALLIERDNDYFGVQYGHSTKDVLGNTDASFGAAMTRLSARVVLAYAAPV